MEYAKMQCGFIRSAVFREADMAARGAWATLVSYCADQANGGRIVGSATWNDRQWLSRTDVVRADVDHLAGSELGRWEGEDLVIIGYDIVSEQAYQEVATRNRQRAVERWERERGAKPAPVEKPKANAGGTEKACRRHPNEVPPAVPPASKTDAVAVPPASKSDANERTNERTIERAPQRTVPEEEDAPSQRTPIPFAASSSSDPVLPTPKPDLATGDKARVRVALGKHGMRGNAVGLEEWFRYLREDVKVRSIEEAEAFLAWVAALGKRQGVPMEHARHAAEGAARSWREVHQHAWQPKPKAAKA